MSAEKFQKMKEVNRRFKAEKSVEAKQSSENGTSTSADLRQRTTGASEMKQDQSPEDIVLRQGSTGDPTVTLDAESYRAKAGVAV